MNVRASLMAPRTGPGSGVTSGGSQPPGSLNTTMSPRFRSNGPGVSLETSTRSPTSNVSSMETDGMKNAWIRNVLISSDSTSAVTSTIAVSRTNAQKPPDWGSGWVSGWVTAWGSPGPVGSVPDGASGSAGA